MRYQLLIEKRAITEVKALPRSIQRTLKNKIKQSLQEHPFPRGKEDIKKIKGSQFLRLRVGDYRVFYSVDKEKHMIYILSIRHRSKAYREF